MFFCLILYIYGLFFNFVLEYIFVYLLVSNTLINCLFFFLPKSVYLRYGSSFFVFLVGISKGKFSVYQLFLDFLSSLAPYMRFFLQNIRLFFIATVSVEFYLYLGSFLYDTVDFNTLCYLFNFCLDAQTLFTFSWFLNFIYFFKYFIYFITYFIHSLIILFLQILFYFIMIGWIFFFLYTGLTSRVLERFF